MTEEVHAQPWLEELPLDTCLALLREHQVGRIAVVAHEFPVILPVNFHLIETVGLTWVAIRARAGGMIDRAGAACAFEIDGIEPRHEEGWSVVVRGTLHHADAEAAGFRERFDSHPWLADREAWLLVEPFSITGRRLHPAAVEPWAFHLRAYL